MILSITTLVSALAVASAHKSFRQKISTSTSTSTSLGGGGSLIQWAPAGPNDFRGPCPMLNTLANHGFLPRDGTNITEANAVHAITTALNFEEAVAKSMWAHGNSINTDPNATFFTLEQLNRVGGLEHDASISREDAYFGNNHVFNQTIFDTSRALWTGNTLTANMVAMSKVYRQVISKAYNPGYKFDEMTETVSLGEMAGPFLVFGDATKGTVSRAMVEFWFQNEKLPSELGWVRKETAIGFTQIQAASRMIATAANLVTGKNATVSARGLEASHFGM